MCKDKAHASFGQMYKKLYVDDLPVFISSDSVLHAWHVSFDSVLKEVESVSY